MPSLTWGLFVALAMGASAGFGLELPAEHNFDEVSKALLGEGQEAWKHFAVPPYTPVASFFEDVKGLLARAHAIKIGEEADGAELYFAVAVVQPHKPYDDDWYNTLRLGLVAKRDGHYEHIDSSADAYLWQLPFPEGLTDAGYFHVDRLETQEVNGKHMTWLTYSYGDSISTPRGWHTIAVLFDHSNQDNRLHRVWQGEVGYKYSGASMGPVEEKTELEFVDGNGDGLAELVSTTTRTETKVYTWKDNRFQRRD
ncbi:MAG: hypothetical protein HYV26_24895 [Candidatus Hydrogenedentes bacterium]|nr:hypothetical protein [Candidatus Hydrogenedentota bacterium]